MAQIRSMGRTSNCCGRAFIGTFQQPWTDKYLKDFFKRVGLTEEQKREYRSYYHLPTLQEDFLRSFDDIIRPNSMGIEISLTTTQATKAFPKGASRHERFKDCKNWHEVVTKEGFREVFRFSNPNTGNHVRIYMRSGAEVIIK